MSTGNYDTAPQSSVGGQPAKIVIETTAGPVGPSNGIPITPPTVNGVKVVGIQEVDSSSTITSPTGKTIQPGGLSWAVEPSSDFVGTIAFGTGTAVAYVGADGAKSRDANPGNTLPGATITCSAGSYKVYEGRPS